MWLLERDPEAGLLHRRLVRTRRCLRAVLAVQQIGRQQLSFVACARLSSPRRTSKRRTSTSSSGGLATRFRAPTSSSSTTTAPTAPPTSPRPRPQSSAASTCCGGRRSRASAARTAPGSRSGSTRATRRSSRSTRISPTTRPSSRTCCARSSPALIWRSARGMCPAVRSRTGRGSGGRCRATATCTGPGFWGRASRTVRPATALYRADTLKSIDYATTRAKGYGFQIETAYRVHRWGGRITEMPIVFTDRVRGHSKMTWGVAAEELLLVTWWGIRDRSRRLWRRLRPG